MRTRTRFAIAMLAATLAIFGLAATSHAKGATPPIPRDPQHHLVIQHHQDHRKAKVVYGHCYPLYCVAHKNGRKIFVDIAEGAWLGKEDAVKSSKRILRWGRQTYGY